MNCDKIVDAIGMIDEELITEADKKTFKKLSGREKHGWKDGEGRVC